MRYRKVNQSSDHSESEEDEVDFLGHGTLLQLLFQFKLCQLSLGARGVLLLSVLRIWIRVILPDPDQKISF